MFYLVGLGLGNHKDVTVKGLEIIKKCSKIYLEAYTSILCPTTSKESLEEFYGKEVNLADREMIESNSDEILNEALIDDVCLLIVGDPFGATTHSDFFLRAKEKNIPVQVVHNASIMNAIGCCGLQLYNFGETVSIVFWTDEWQPDSYFEKISANMERGLHTLCLLDIKMKEQTVENMMKKRPIFEPPRFMTASEAADQLLKIAQRRAGESKLGIDESTVCVALARVGWDDQKIVSCSLSDMRNKDLGPPLHCLIICGSLHPLESDMLKLWSN